MEKFYTRPECSDETGIAIRTLERWSKKKLPPAKYDGRTPLYSEAQNAVAKSLHQPEFSGHKNSTTTDTTKTETVSFFEPPLAADIVDTETLITESLDGKSLDDLAAEANLYTERGDKCLGEGLTFYFAAGRRLNEAKSRVGHGHWQNWLADNFSASADTAQNYMKLARRFGTQDPKLFRNLGLAAMIKLLALPDGDEQKFIDAQAEAGKPAELQSARELQRNVKEFNDARVTSKNSTEEPTLDLSNSGESCSGCSQEFLGTDSAKRSTSTVSIDETAAQILPSNADAPAKKLPPIALNRNETVKWYTPQNIIDAAREVLGTIDLDPASDAEANQTVKAQEFYSVDEDGLLQDWRGRIWLNPPFANGLIDKFVDKLLAEIERGFVTAAICLTDNATETRWFRKLADNSVAIVFTTGRINFLKADASHSGTPTRGQAFFYYGANPDKFFQVFSKFGWCCKVFADDFTAKK